MKWGDMVNREPNRKPLSMSCALLLCWVATAGSVAAAAAPHHRATYGYTLDVPADWVQVPDESVKELLAAVQQPGQKSAIIYDAAFQPKANPEWLQHPYVLIQVMPYRNVGVNRQLRESEFESVVKAITGQNLQKEIEEKGSAAMREMISDISVGRPQLDAPNRRFYWQIDSTVQDVGRVRGQSAGHFGRDAIVMVNFYSLDKEWDRLGGTRKAMFDSFRFDAAQAFDPAQDRGATSARRLGYLFGSAVVPIALIAAVVAVVLWATKKKQPQPPAPHQWSPPTQPGSRPPPPPPPR